MTDYTTHDYKPRDFEIVDLKSTYGLSSFPRKWESRFWRFHPTAAWMPAFAGMTELRFT